MCDPLTAPEMRSSENKEERTVRQRGYGTSLREGCHGLKKSERRGKKPNMLQEQASDVKRGTIKCNRTKSFTSGSTLAAENSYGSRKCSTTKQNIRNKYHTQSQGVKNNLRLCPHTF